MLFAHKVGMSKQPLKVIRNSVFHCCCRCTCYDNKLSFLKGGLRESVTLPPKKNPLNGFKGKDDTTISFERKQFLKSVSSFSDEPEIEVEAEKVHSGVGKEAHLTCIVHGEPKPTVRWFKDNMELKNSGEKIRIESTESTNRHTLILRGLASQQDFGNYSCVAENTLGSSK